MTEEHKPDFTVVDRRRGTSSNEVGGSEEAPTVPHSQDAVADERVEASEDTSAAGDEGLPDPAFLLSLAAVRMDTKSLAKALLSVFDTHAWQAMGLIANPLTGTVNKDLPTAQIAIDCVQFFLSKVDADLSEPERREAQRRLSDLRMNYVAKVREG